MDTKKIRDYFLSPQEELRQEDFDLTENVSIFELVEQVESGLVDEYVLGELSSEERQAFESHYLVTEARLAKVNETRRLVLAANDLRSDPDQKTAYAWLGWIFSRGFAFSASAAAILIIGLVVYLALHRKTAVQTVKIESPLEIQTFEENKPQNPAGAIDAPKTSDKNADKPSKTFTPAMISLSPRNFRSSGREIVILKEDTRVPFLIKLDVESGARLFSSYSIRIETPDGELVPTSTTVMNKEKHSLTVSVSGKFEAGTYIVYLTGLENDSSSEPVEEYAFRVVERERQ